MLYLLKCFEYECLGGGGSWVVCGVYTEESLALAAKERQESALPQRYTIDSIQANTLYPEGI